MIRVQKLQGYVPFLIIFYHDIAKKSMAFVIFYYFVKDLAEQAGKFSADIVKLHKKVHLVLDVCTNSNLYYKMYLQRQKIML